MLHYVKSPPSPALAPYIRLFRVLYGELETPQHFPYFPEGRTDIVFNFSGEMWRTADLAAAPAARIGTDIISGSALTTHVFNFSGRVDIFNINLTMLGMPVLFDMPAGLLTDVSAPLTTICSHLPTQRLADLAALPPLERIRPIEDWLLSLLAKRQTDTYMQQLVNALRQTRGKGSVRDIVSDLPVSERTLNRLFYRYIGLSPKRYLRLLRFGEVMRLLADTTHPTLAQVALEAGYYDQAHLDHELVMITGLPASRLIEAVASNYLLQNVSSLEL